MKRERGKDRERKSKRAKEIKNLREKDRERKDIEIEKKIRKRGEKPSRIE